MTEDRRQALGVVGELVRGNVQRIREAQRLTYVELSKRLGEAGRPIPVLGLRRIERGERRVDTDDLVALARVLAVSPLTLLLPWTDDPLEQIELPGSSERATAELLWVWADGMMPLHTSETDREGDIQRFRLDSRPAWARDWTRYLTLADALRLSEEATKVYNEARESQLSPQEAAERWNASWRRPDEKPS